MLPCLPKRANMGPCPPSHRFTAIIYPLIVALLLWGPQVRLSVCVLADAHKH